MSCSMQSKTQVVTLWTYDNHVSKEGKKKKKKVYIPKWIIEENLRDSHRVASAIDKKIGA